MPEPNPLRRRLLLTSFALPALTACATPLPPLTAPATTRDARRLLETSAAAHGLAAFASLRDLNVAYSGTWRPIIDRLQPALVDAGFRGGAEERLLPGAGLVAQTHHGPHGIKHVVREAAPNTAGSVRVWFNDAETTAADPCAAAALVGDGYSLFLLGPLWLAARAADDPDALRMEVGGRVRLVLLQGLGAAELRADYPDALLHETLVAYFGRAATAAASHAERHAAPAVAGR